MPPRGEQHHGRPRRDQAQRAAERRERGLAVPAAEIARGQLLARMQSSALAEAQRAYLQAMTQRELARANLDRDQKLAADGLIAESRLLSTKASHVEAAALLAERRHALKLAGMSDQAIGAIADAGGLDDFARMRGVPKAKFAECLSSQSGSSVA